MGYNLQKRGSIALDCLWCCSKIDDRATVCKECSRSQNKLVGYVSSWSIVEIIGLLLTIFSTVFAYTQASKATSAYEEVKILQERMVHNNLRSLVESLESESDYVSFFCAPAQLDRNTCDRAESRFFYSAANKIVDIRAVDSTDEKRLVSQYIKEICVTLNKSGKTYGTIPDIKITSLKEVLEKKFGVVTLTSSVLKNIKVCY